MTGLSRRLLLSTPAAGAAAALVGARPARAQAKEVLTFAAAFFAEAGRGDRARAWVDKFNKSQDRVEVQTISIPFSQLANTVFTQMGGGGGPDIVRFDQTDFFAAVPTGRIVPVDDMLDLSKYRFQPADRFVKVDGKRMGLVFETANYAMLYNPALLPDGKPPTTFDGFAAAAKEATGRGKFGYAFRTTMPERAGMWADMTNYVYGFGGQWGDDGKPTLNSPEVVEAMTQYKRIFDLGVTPRGADAATYRRMFWEGKIGINIDNGGVGGIFSAQAPDFKFDAAPSPFPHKQQGIVLTMLAVNANSKKRDAAAAFMTWMLQPEPQADLQFLLGASNVATTVPRAEEELRKYPWVKAFDENTPYGQPLLVRSLEGRTLDIQQVVVENAIKMLIGGVEPKKAMDEAQAQTLTRLARSTPQ